MSFFQDITQPGVGPIVGAAITAIVSINTMFLKWLINKFDKLSEGIIHLAKTHQEQLDEHEEKDQVRHEQNLKRFETISVALTRLDMHVEDKKDRT